MTTSAVCIALATALSYITLFQMPQGGSVSPCVMLFVALPGYMFGALPGIVSGIVYGLTHLVLKPYIVSPPQVIFDYVLAFGALGFSGFFAGKKYGLFSGYVAGALGRLIFSTLSGVVFFYMYAEVAGVETLGAALASPGVWLYSIGYNGSYIGAEALITLVLLMIPALRDVIDVLKKRTAQS